MPKSKFLCPAFIFYIGCFKFIWDLIFMMPEVGSDWPGKRERAGLEPRPR